MQMGRESMAMRQQEEEEKRLMRKENQVRTHQPSLVQTARGSAEEASGSTAAAEEETQKPEVDLDQPDERVETSTPVKGLRQDLPHDVEQQRLAVVASGSFVFFFSQKG